MNSYSDNNMSRRRGPMAHIEGSINNKGHKQMDERNICLQEYYSTNFLRKQYENSTKVLER